MYYATQCLRNIFSDNMEKLDVFHNVTKRLYTINLLSESSDKSWPLLRRDPLILLMLWFNFILGLNFILLFLGMVMYDNDL